jgi:hypothetical protein
MHQLDADRRDPALPERPLPTVTSLDLTFCVTDFPSGWNSALSRWQRIDVESSEFAVARPQKIGRAHV